MDPIGLCFAQSLWAIKHFQDFKTANFRQYIESVKHPSQYNNKIERCQMDPLGSASQSYFWG